MSCAKALEPCLTATRNSALLCYTNKESKKSQAPLLCSNVLVLARVPRLVGLGGGAEGNLSNRVYSTIRA